MHYLQNITKELSIGSRRKLLQTLIVTFILSFHGLNNNFVQAITPADQEERGESGDGSLTL